MTVFVRWKYNNTETWLQAAHTNEKKSYNSRNFNADDATMQISIETHITCVFQRGSGPPTPLLDLHMRFHNLFFLFQKETLAVASQKIHLKKTIHLSTKANVWTYR